MAGAYGTQIIYITAHLEAVFEDIQFRKTNEHVQSETASAEAEKRLQPLGGGDGKIQDRARFLRHFSK